MHDVGRVGVPNGIWYCPGPLSADQWERVRLHPYLTERVLRRCPLAPFADVAARHHERADGSGYHRETSGDQLDVGARLLAAADAYHAMTEDRPHRPALTPSEAAVRSSLRTSPSDASDGSRLMPCWPPPASDVCRLGPPTRPVSPTARSKVPRRIARGQLNKQVAAVLGIRQDGRPPRRAHLRQGRGRHPGLGDPVRHGAQPPVALSAAGMG